MTAEHGAALESETLRIGRLEAYAVPAGVFGIDSSINHPLDSRILRNITIQISGATVGKRCLWDQVHLIEVHGLRRFDRVADR